MRGDARSAWLALRLAAVLATAQAAGAAAQVLPRAAPDAEFAQASSPRVFEFPRDHGPHSAFRQEWWYVTGNLDAAGGADALVEGAKLFAGAPDGLMPWRGRPDALKRGLVARTPPFDFAGDRR